MPRIRLTGLLLLLAAFTGCITIEENYTFKKDGSGTMEYVVDMSQFGEMMKAFEGMGDGKDKGKKKDDSLDKLNMKDEVNALKSIPGIRKVKLNDKDAFVQKVSFAFADVDALNGALNVLLKDTTGIRHTFFSWEGSTLVRSSNGHARDIGMGMSMGDEADGDTTDMTEFLSSMKYKYRFSFAEPIAGTTTAEGVAQENPDTRTVKLDTDFGAISRDEKVLDLRIELKR